MSILSIINYNLRKVIVPVTSIFVFTECLFFLFIVVFCVTNFMPKNTKRYQNLLDQVKNSFIIILSSITRVVAPSRVRITTDNATIAPGTFFRDVKLNRIFSKIKPNSVSICNHQIYTDWVFLWWLAYTSGFGGRVYIMLKKSLQKIPVLGYGMNHFQFIFMNRKWADDRVNLINHFRELDANARGLGPITGHKPSSIEKDGLINWNSHIRPSAEHKSEGAHSKYWPYNVILFPEGTNLTANTRGQSARYAAKINKVPYKNVLIPHATGLRVTLQTLEPSIDVLYDVTIAYSGFKQSSYAATAYGLKSIFLEGKFPEVADIYIRAIDLKDIPFHDDDKFLEWIYQIWQDKDDLLDNYYKNGRFDLDPSSVTVIENAFSINFYQFAFVLALPAVTFVFILYYLFIR